MSFTAEQKAALAAKLDPRHVANRSQAGQTLSYIEGWHAIDEANRIFGFDGWDRETVETTCVWSGNRDTKKGPKPAASYVARVRVTVRTPEGREIVREGTGAGSGFGNDHGEAHESAIKEAETDAMKRALMTFGNPFGLALYDKTKANVGRDEGEPRRTANPTTDTRADDRARWDEWARKEEEKLVEMDEAALEAWREANAKYTAKLGKSYPDLSERLWETFNYAADELALKSPRGTAPAAAQMAAG